MQVISDAFDIVKKGILYPEIFQLVSLFEENIGPDRLSDMISTIIYPDIVAYTKRIQWLMSDVYMDVATSKTGASRKEFNRMLDDCRSN